MAKVQRFRAVAYIDGFNLYFGLRDAGYRRYYWLDLRRLAASLLHSRLLLADTKYFTARIAGADGDHSPAEAAEAEARRKRQSDYIEAVKMTGVKVFEGHYRPGRVQCRQCGHWWRSHQEKMTDVQIATQLMADAARDRFDTAILITGDSDLVPPIRMLKELTPAKRVVVAFPPRRFSDDLKREAYTAFHIGEAALAGSILPDEIAKPDGYVLRRPATWR